MKEIQFNTIQAFNDFHGFETLHPLISVAHFDRETEVEEAVYHYGLYCLFLKENKGCKLSYGLTDYDFDEMTVTSFAPGQTIHVAPNPEVKYPRWTAIVFHPDLLNRTPLGKSMEKYEFFDYSSNEALHLSTAEIEIFRDVLSMIAQELHHTIDKHTRELIVNHIELLLNYCLRFYDRQFVTREEINHSVVKKFSKLLDEYIAERAQREGLPMVGYLPTNAATRRNISGRSLKPKLEKRRKTSSTTDCYTQPRNC